MTEININLNETKGIIKPMNAVNNGPTPQSVRASYSSFDAYKALEIPYARNHDASFFTEYGGEHTVDVHRIFRNFDADENDPASYIFEPTDKYIKHTLDAGTETFYRLGASIEHNYKYGTRVPKDYEKWARICEHIIRHYNEGWADGFEYNIKYWEIWNEPDCLNADGTGPCWQGTKEQFMDFYCVVAKHIKSCFPNIKLGGPAFCTVWPEGSKDVFLDMIVENNVPLDFFSYHWYGKNLDDLAETINYARKLLDSKGLTDTGAILNEWNYIKGWLGEDWNYSLRSEKNIKGSSFIAGAMCTAQALPLDMLMYYDARPCGMNGLFAHETYECLKGYYTFVMFREIKKLGNYVPTDYCTDDIYSCASTDGKNSAVMLTYYNDDDASPSKQVSVSFNSNTKNTRAEVYLLDKNNDLTHLNTQYFSTDKFSLRFDMEIHSSILVKLFEE